MECLLCEAPLLLVDGQCIHVTVVGCLVQLVQFAIAKLILFSVACEQTSSIPVFVCGVQFSDAALAAAAALDCPLDAAQLEEGEARLKEVNEKRGEKLDGLIETLVDLFEEGNL